MKEEWYFEFSGTWTWGCYASSLEEAKRRLLDEGYDELDISDPLTIDEYCDTGEIETYELD